MRVGWAETRPDHPDPALRPRIYEASYDDVFRSCAALLGELSSLEVAEADPRRGVIEGWVKLGPMASLPVLGPKKHPREHGKGWFDRLDPRLSKGWLQLRVDALEGKNAGKVQVSAQVRLELPFAGFLARQLLKGYLRWIDTRRGLPRRA